MTHKIVQVLVVDDSAYMRKVIREMLGKSIFIEVLDTARSGEEALEKAVEQQPDVIITDLLMPDMDGVAFIREQMRRPLPIVVCSSVLGNGEKVVAAMEAGAVEFVQKPTALALETMYDIQQMIVQAVRSAAAVPFEKLAVPEPVPEVETVPAGPILTRGAAQIEAVLIGISTGGPRALRAMLPRFPKDLSVAMAIVLHMPPGYTQPMAEKLNEICQIEVLESTEGLAMQPGRAILAQAGLHTRLVRAASGLVTTTLGIDPMDNPYIPAVDELFRSGAEVYGRQALAVVMTGMGNDGTVGAGWIKAQGGIVFAEAEESSVIFGMPRSVIEAGLADRVVPLNYLPEAIMEVIL